MEWCDSDHAKIEKARKTFLSFVNNPSNRRQLIKYPGENKLLVVEMSQKMFFDFNGLSKKTYQMKKTDENKKRFFLLWCKVYLLCMKNEKVMVYFKTSIDLNTKFHKMNSNRRNPISMIIPKVYDFDLCISEEKKDLTSLLKYIRETFHNFL